MNENIDALTRDLAIRRRPMAYLSGPMSARDALSRARHRHAALDASHQLWEAGVLHYCPHANGPAIGCTDVPYEEWMAMDIEALRRCDFIIMVAEWTSSPGCRRELALALHLGMPVAYSIETAIELYKNLRAA
jgi:hypothetical protein